MEFKKETYKQGKYRIIFDEPDWYAFDALKNNEEYFLAISIRVFQTDNDGKERELGSYFREFDKEPNRAHVSKFIDNFLADKEYRKQYFVDGKEWEDVILPKETSNPLINPRCALAIRQLNERKESKLKFKDFANLKTYGMDSFSRMKEDKLKDIIDEEIVKKVSSELADNEKMKVSAYKWIARGLKPNLAIRKVKTDAEISANAQGCF